VFSTRWGSAGELCAIVVREGQVTRYACGPSAAKPDNLAKLCGYPMADYYGFTTLDTTGVSGRGSRRPRSGTKLHPLRDEEVLGCASVDLNGRYCLPDFLLLTRNGDGMIGGVPMGYRGYGAFLCNPGITQNIDWRARQAKADFPPGTIPVMGGQAPGAGTRQHVLLLKPNGELWRIFNAGG
jgi:hypothetical protein